MILAQVTLNVLASVLISCKTTFQGCKYCHDKFQRDYGSWTAFRTLDYGYTRVQVFNSSHLYLEQVSIDQVRLNVFIILFNCSLAYPRLSLCGKWQEIDVSNALLKLINNSLRKYKGN